MVDMEHSGHDLKALYVMHNSRLWLIWPSSCWESIWQEDQNFQSDEGEEFTSNEFINHLTQHDISHQLSCPQTPRPNGCVEQKH